MKKLLGAVAALAVVGGGAYGGWVYAGKPDLLAAMQGDGEATASKKSSVSGAEIAKLTSKYEDILTEEFVVEGAAETPAADVIALLPETLELTIGSSEFDAASGATIWKGVSLTGAESSDLGIQADEVKLWGLNTDAIAARVAGTNLDETVTLAERIEAKGVKSLGLETMATNFLLSYIEGIDRTISAVAPEEGLSDDQRAEFRAAMEMVVDTYQFETGHLVAVSPKLRPWEIKRIDVEEALENEDASQTSLFVLQEIAAYYRTFGVDEMILADTKFRMVMEQEGIKQDASGGYGLIAYSDWNGGDIQRAVMTDLTMKQIMDMREVFADLEPTAADAPEFFQEMNLEFSIAMAAVEGMKFDKVLRHVAMGEWPSTEETDLMAYGRVDMRGMDTSFNNETFFAIDQAILDFSNWHWFIPTKAEITLNGFEYDIQGIFRMMQPALEAEDPEAWSVIEKIMEISNKYEALPFVYDTTVLWDWNPETGAFNFKTPQTHRKFGRASFEFSGVLPNYEDGVAAVKTDMAYEPAPDADFWEERMRKTAWDILLEESFQISGAYLQLEDQGGLDKIFPIASEVGKLNPDEFGPMLANSTPETLRTAAVSAIGFSAIEAGKNFPQAESWVMAFADWVRDGGTVTFEMKPSEPLGQNMALKHAGATPDEIVDILGITVTHTKP